MQCFLDLAIFVAWSKRNGESPQGGRFGDATLPGKEIACIAHKFSDPATLRVAMRAGNL